MKPATSQDKMDDLIARIVPIYEAQSLAGSLAESWTRDYQVLLAELTPEERVVFENRRTDNEF